MFRYFVHQKFTKYSKSELNNKSWFSYSFFFKSFPFHKNSSGYLFLQIVKIETLWGYLFLQIWRKFAKISNNKVYWELMWCNYSNRTRNFINNTYFLRLKVYQGLSHNFASPIKGYLRYKTIPCHKVALDVQLMNFLIWRKNNV